eukprot:gene5977-6930_t
MCYQKSISDINVFNTPILTERIKNSFFYFNPKDGLSILELIIWVNSCMQAHTYLPFSRPEKLKLLPKLVVSGKPPPSDYIVPRICQFQHLRYAYEVTLTMNELASYKQAWIIRPFLFIYPSTCDLSPIWIDELLLNHTHSGRVLIVRTIMPAVKVNGLYLVAEDQRAEPFGSPVVTVHIFGMALPGRKGVDKEVDDIIPTGTIFAIKEPHFKVAPCLGFVVRVDSVAQIEFIDDPDHPLITNPRWKSKLPALPKDVVKCRAVGNQYLLAGRFSQAITTFDRGLMLEPDNQPLLQNKLVSLASLDRNYEVVDFNGSPPDSSNLVPRDPIAAHKLSMLYAGPTHDHNKSINLDDFRPPKELPPRASAPTMSQDRLAKIVSHNSFAVSDASGPEQSVALYIFDFRDHQTPGIWALPSLLNHSCIANTTRFFYGDMMFLTAYCDIKAGQELTATYNNPEESLAERRKNLTMLSITDHCQCMQCQHDEKEEPLCIRKRKELDAYFESTLMPLATNNDPLVIPRLVQHIGKYEKTYQAKRPVKVGLRSSMVCLADLYGRLKMHDKGYELYMRLLKHLGYDGLDSMNPNPTRIGTSNALNFVVKTPVFEGAAVVTGIDSIFVHASARACASGRIDIGRKLLALSNLYSRIGTGLSHSKDNLANDTITFK